MFFSAIKFRILITNFRNTPKTNTFKLWSSKWNIVAKAKEKNEQVKLVRDEWNTKPFDPNLTFEISPEKSLKRI